MRLVYLSAAMVLSLSSISLAQERAMAVGADADARVTLTNTSGSINVSVCDRNEVVVFGSRGTARKVDIEATPKHVELKMNQGGELRVCVPRRAQLRAASASGSVRVEGVEGTVDIESASGTLQIEGRPRSIHAMAFSGGVTIMGGGTEVTRAESVSGTVMITRAAGIVEAKSSSGGVNVKGDVRDAQLFSVSGSVMFDGTVQSGGRLTAESSSGSVELRLPRDLSAEYELATISADIDNDFGPRPVKPRHGPGETLRFSVGNGGARIRANSVSGSIILDDR
jgi:hypothetical protein